MRRAMAKLDVTAVASASPRSRDTSAKMRDAARSSPWPIRRSTRRPRRVTSKSCTLTTRFALGRQSSSSTFGMTGWLLGFTSFPLSKCLYSRIRFQHTHGYFPWNILEYFGIFRNIDEGTHVTVRGVAIEIGAWSPASRFLLAGAHRRTIAYVLVGRRLLEERAHRVCTGWSKTVGGAHRVCTGWSSERCPVCGEYSDIPAHKSREARLYSPEYSGIQKCERTLIF